MLALLLRQLALVPAVRFTLSSLIYVLFHISFLVLKRCLTRGYGGELPGKCYCSFSGMKLKAEVFGFFSVAYHSPETCLFIEWT